MAFDWHKLLDGSEKHVSTPEQSRSAAFGEGAVIPLEDLGVIRVHGPDARDFLHAQLTQDIQQLVDDRWLLSGYCNPMGRLLGLFRVLHSDQGFLVLTRRELLDALLRRLHMFVLRSKVTLEDASADNAGIGLIGAAALNSLDELAGSVAEGPGGVHHAGDLVVATLGGEPDRFLVLAPAGEAKAVWSSLATGVTVADTAVWDLLDIIHGLPEIYPATSGKFVPQQVNLELLDGIHFRKGCYPGQEVVARMHYLGKPSRRMFRLSGPADGAALPRPGEPVTTADGSNAGAVVRAAAGRENTLELLAVLKLEHRDRQDLTVGGVAVGFGELPYRV